LPKHVEVNYPRWSRRRVLGLQTVHPR